MPRVVTEHGLLSVGHVTDEEVGASGVSEHTAAHPNHCSLSRRGFSFVRHVDGAWKFHADRPGTVISVNDLDSQVWYRLHSNLINIQKSRKMFYSQHQERGKLSHVSFLHTGVSLPIEIQYVRNDISL